MQFNVKKGNLRFLFLQMVANTFFDKSVVD